MVESIGLVFIVLGPALLCGSLVMVWLAGRRRGEPAYVRDLVRVLARDRRKDLMAQVRGQRPADPHQLPLARELAGTLVDQRWSLGGITGSWIGILGHSISDPATWRTVSVVVFVPFVVVFGILVERDARRAAHFLAAHPVAP